MGNALSALGCSSWRSRVSPQAQEPLSLKQTSRARTGAVGAVHSIGFLEDLSAFPGALAAGHGIDSRQSFVRQSQYQRSSVSDFTATPRSHAWYSETRGSARNSARNSRADSRLTKSQLSSMRESAAAPESDNDSPHSFRPPAQPVAMSAMRRDSCMARQIMSLDEQRPQQQPAKPQLTEYHQAADRAPELPIMEASSNKEEEPVRNSIVRPVSFATREDSSVQPPAPQLLPDRLSVRSISPLEADGEAAPATPRMQWACELGSELGAGSPPPLPLAVCGNFSCAGMEEDVLKTNQDRGCVAFALPADESAALFIVLDGHGERGHLVSHALLEQLHERLSTRTWAAPDAELTQHLVESFEGAHAQLARAPLGEDGVAAGRESGAAAVVALLRRGHLLVAHAGDCRAVLGRAVDGGGGGGGDGGGVTAVELTEDHTLEVPAEAARIAETGAWIRPRVDEPYFAPARLFFDATDPTKGPGLTMARSLGDMDADAAGVIPTPEVSQRRLVAGRDLFIVLASDGVWEFLSTDHVVEVVAGFRARGEPAAAAARFLIAKAAIAWRMEEGDYRDDITAIVVYLEELPDALRPPPLTSSA